MNFEEDILIERFLNDSLTKEEQDSFLKKMKIDVIFRKKVLLEKQLLETLNDDDWSFIENKNTTQTKEITELYRSEEIEKIKKTIQNVNNSYQSRTIKKHKKWGLYASIAVIVVLFSIYMFIDSSFSSQELYTHYLRNEDLPSLITRAHHKNILAEGQEYFENKDYDKAVVIFKNEFQKNEKQNATIYLYLGIAQMELNEFKNAETTFNALISSDLIDAPKGAWYKALLHLKMGQINESKLLLSKIVTNRSYNFKQASDLLKELP